MIYSYIFLFIYSLSADIYLSLPLYLHDQFHFSSVDSTIFSAVYMFGIAVGLVAFKYISIKNFYTEKSIQCIRALNVLLFGICLMVFKNILHSNDYIFDAMLFFMGIFSSLMIPLLMVTINFKAFKNNHLSSANKQRIITNLGMALFLILMVYFNKGYIHVYKLIGIVFIVCSLIEIYSFYQFKSKSRLNVNSSTTNAPKYNSKFQIIFFLITFLTVLAFLTINTIQAFYIVKHLHLSYTSLYFFWIINAVLIVLLQSKFIRFTANIMRPATCYSFGILLIAVSIVVPVIYLSTLTVIMSIIIWTAGEIMFFTECRRYLIAFSNGNMKSTMKTMSTYYLLYYSTGMLIPIIIYTTFSLGGYKQDLILISIFTILLSLTSFYMLSIRYKDKYTRSNSVQVKLEG